MGFFDEDDPFDSIVREFFGGSPLRRGTRKQKFVSGEEEERNIDYIEDKDKIFIVFELPGYSKEDISIIVKGKNLEINANKIKSENVQTYLKQKLDRGISINKQLPEFINSKKFDHNMNNGVLEIVFEGGKRK